MSDLFHEDLSNEQIAAVFGVMAATPQHIFQVLTKRPERMREWFEWVTRNRGMTPYVAHEVSMCVREAEKHVGSLGADCTWPLPHVWLGTSVENRSVLHRLDALRASPAALRFVSAEPLLEDLGKVDLNGIGWMITGCESGTRARSCEIGWLRALRDQCKEVAVPFFLKQAHETIVFEEHADAPPPFTTRLKKAIIAGPASKRKAKGLIELPYLDGVQHAEFPKVQS